MTRRDDSVVCRQDDRRHLPRASLEGRTTATEVTTAPNNRAASIPVTLTIHDVQDNHPLRVQSDPRGPDVRTPQIFSSIERYSQGLTDWFLQTYFYTKRKLTASERTVFFDLREPVSFANPVPPVTTEYLQAHLTAKCSHVNVDMLTMTVGSTVACPGAFRFLAADGRWYRLAFNPEYYAQVDRLSVACLTADATGCASWSIAPTGLTRTGTDPNPKNRAN